jgi:hypothetical protein
MIGHQEDRIEAAITKIELIRLFFQKSIAEKILITDCKITVFRNRRLPREI